MANKDILGFGKDLNDIAQPIGITGTENNQLLTYSIEDVMLCQKILKELKIMNLHLSLMTDT